MEYCVNGWNYRCAITKPTYAINATRNNESDDKNDEKIFLDFTNNNPKIKISCVSFKNPQKPDDVLSRLPFLCHALLIDCMLNKQ